MTVEAALFVVDAAQAEGFEQPSRANISPSLGRQDVSEIAASSGYDPEYIKDVGLAATLKSTWREDH